MAKQRTCVICRKKYSYCPSCAADANKPTWMFVFCCENCRTLYNVINDYRNNLVSKEDAFNKINVLDLSDVDKLIPEFKDILSDILSFKFENIESAKEDFMMIPEESNDVKDYIPTEPKPVRTKKRKNISKDIDE